MMAGAQKGEEGVVGAVLYTTLQIGATIGVAVVTAIQLGVEEKMSEPGTSYEPYEASFWSLVGMHGLLIIVTLLFVRN